MKRYKRQIYLFFLTSLVIVLGSFSVLFINYRKQLKLQKELLQVVNNLRMVDLLKQDFLQLETLQLEFKLTNEKVYLEKADGIIANVLNLYKKEKLFDDEGSAGRLNDIAKLIGKSDVVNVQQTSKKAEAEILALENDLKKSLDLKTQMINNKSTANRAGMLILLVIFVLLMVYAARRFQRALEKLIDTHTKFREAQRIAKIGSWEWNFETGNVIWSHEQYRLFGKDRSIFVPTFDGLLAHLRVRDQRLLKEAVAKTVADKTNLMFEHEILREDGTIIVVCEQGSLLYDDKGKPLGMFGTTQDITDDKKAENDLVAAKKKFQAIFDNTADGIYQSTPEGKFIIANKSMARIFGYDSPEELIDSVTHIGTQLYADPGERRKMAIDLLKHDQVKNLELQVYTKKRSVIWVSANIRVVRTETGDLNYFEGTLEDITERKDAEEKILQLNRSLDQFANITAHDLQEPIRMVSGFLGLLHKKYADVIDEQGQNYIYRAKDGADRMSLLIKDLLEYSRSGNKSAKIEMVDIAGVMDLVDKDMSIVMADTGTKLRIPSELPLVIGNHSALYRLFLNLVSNGIKFRKKDTVPEITLSVIDCEDFWQFTLKDNGIGVAEKDQPKLFQAFQRLHRRDEYPGTGLGLVTCKKIIEIHGGRIWMDSEASKGTSFHFTLRKLNTNEAA